jgi:hypothetical protein
MVEDARRRTRIYLKEYLDGSALTDDVGENEVKYIVVYGDPGYPVTKVFGEPKNVTVVFTVEEPESSPLVDFDGSIYGYDESLPIKISCIDKQGVTATKLKWKAEEELRRILEGYPFGSFRSLTRRSGSASYFGASVFYETTWVLHYSRDTT